MPISRLHFLLAVELGRALAAQGAPAEPTTVVILGVHHAPGNLLHAAMSPGHVRAALDAAAATAIGVESPPEWFGRGGFYRATWEASGIAVPYAAERQLPVHGIDWIGENSGDYAERQRHARLAAERERLAAPRVDPRHYSFGACTVTDLRAAEPDPDCDFTRLNGDAFAAQWNTWLDTGRATPGTPQAYIAERNAKIADHIAAAAASHPGGRLAVVIGAAHRGDLLRLLPARGLRVEPLPDLAPDQDHRLLPIDLAAMVAYALDNAGGRSPAVDRFTALRERLAKAEGLPPELATVQRYVAARWAMLTGDHDRARAEFTELAEAGQAVRFPFRGSEWRLHLTVGQAAQLESGRLADLRGDRAVAVAAYRALLASLPEPVFDADYLADFEFTATAHNAVRALCDTPFATSLTFASLPPAMAAPKRDAAAVAGADAGLRRAWELHRAGKWRELRDAVAAIDRKALVATAAVELDYHLAAASVALGERQDAETRIGQLEQRVAELGPQHWLARSLPDLRRKL